MLRLMGGLGRRLAGVGAVFIVASFVVVGAAAPPASAAYIDSPDWLPLQSALPSSAIDERFTNPYYTRPANKARTAWKLEMDTTLRTAAERGAYIPGLTDLMRETGKGAWDVPTADIEAHFQKYGTRPGSTASFLPATVATKGVVTVTDSKGLTKTIKPGGSGKELFMKVGNAAAVGAAIVGTAEVGVAVGTGVAGLVGLPTSGSFLCDVATAFAGSNCGLAGVEGYIPNQDLGEGIPAGWATTNGMTYEPANSGSESYLPFQMVYNVTKAPEFGATSGTVQVEWVQSGACGPLGTQTRGARVRAMGLNSLGQMKEAGRAYLTASLKCESPKSGTAVATMSGSGLKFDHVELMIIEGQYVNVHNLLWYPEGHELWTPGVGADARRHWLSAWTCTEGPGGQAQSVWYRETDDRIPGVPQASCASGQVQTLTVSQVTEGVGSEVVYEWELPQKTSDFIQNYPECADGTCLLDLKSKVTGTEVSCFKSPELCTDWIKDAQKETNFQCYYGGKKVGLSECYIYGTTFNRDLAIDNPYGDPDTGLPQEDIDTGMDPGPGGGPKVEDYDPNCPPKFTAGGLFSGWWVYKGTSCALKEVFVPNKANIATQVSKVKTTLDSKPPFTLVAPATSTINGFKTGWDGGCSKPLAEFDPWKQGRLTIPCSPPQSAPLTALYGVATAGIVGATVFAVWHMLTAAIGGRDAGTGD